MNSYAHLRKNPKGPTFTTGLLKLGAFLRVGEQAAQDRRRLPNLGRVSVGQRPVEKLHAARTSCTK